MNLDTYLVFLPACFAINMAFGPNNLLSLTNGAREGVWRATAAAGGRLVAFAIMIVIAALGLGAVLATSEMLFSVVKWAGAAYLVYLGFRLLRAGAPELTTLETSARTPLGRLALQEFWVAAGNPKAILVFTAFFPQFLDSGNHALSFLVMGATFIALEVVAIAAYAAFGGRLRSLTRGRRALKLFNRVSGSLMIGFGIMLALTRRPTA
ncbi:LysE family translocator [Chelatococcus daeguensis]|uniref:Threonine/homoserine/homoserine lactone efflux protein n=1 Tax=Chelatococcus sambhunathii TaxID=363953 RepID=A0ABM9U7E8_9HYPH|nr:MULTISPECIES: LysE family translocator [Chelatococcus]KZE30726.1 lysine transporter LysE [Chelatococcus daeguensis]MBM3082104.1 LysE family translocator [Chelatococcus daeguensis]CUA88932.1 Threonine/homoserine/homoserine lactone efflux protein [Chelatococcus sambhunathii]